MKTEFTAEDFGSSNSGLNHAAAEKANRVLPEIKKAWLEELLKDAPVVYGQKTMKHDGWKMDWKFRKEPFHTHTARLGDIKEIEK